MLSMTPASAQWQKIGIRSHHGINIPLFALHSLKSCGIGEYLDLIPMIDWCRTVGFDVIQLLPLNDTGIDTGPYAALSANALNPVHLSLAELPYTQDNPSLAALLNDLHSLNQTQRICYPQVQLGKEQFLREYYRCYADQFEGSSKYNSFKEQHPWLLNYALFKALKIKFNWQSWESWPEPWKHPQSSILEEIPPDLNHEIAFHSFIQYLCFSQLEAVKKHADQQNIFLKGDIPILINRESADVWFYQHLFLLDFSAGAPPDMFSQEGQKWGFPLYNWTAAKNQNYQWWIDRLHTAQRLYHIYRIDHIIGFFRIWAIPLDLPAKEGYFYPAQQQDWLPQGEEIMRMMLANSSMLPIGEDLGVVPPEVRLLMQSLGICGTKVMRWERYWNTDQRFIAPEVYPLESMTTVSTHDSETLELWWKNNPQDAIQYASEQGWNYTPELSVEQRLDILKQSHHSGSLFHINLLQEYFPLASNMTWDNPEDERINIPGTVSEENWSYRFRPSVEEITSNEALKKIIPLIKGFLPALIWLFIACQGLSAQETSPGKLKMLYNSLDPRSIAQHLALYDLYPTSNEGQQAFHDACKLLTGENNRLLEQLHFLPSLSSAVHGIVAIINKSPDTENIDLSNEELALINKLGARLSNRSLKGYNAPDEHTVLQLPPEQIDLARGVLLSQLGNSPDAIRKVMCYESTIDLMALQLLTRISLNDPPPVKIRAINEFIFSDLGFRFPPHSSYAKDVDLYTFLPSVLDSRRGVCLGVSILYMSLAQRLALNLEMITPPGHIYVRWRQGKEEINIETTARGIDVPSKEYLGVDTRSLQQRNIKEVIGMAHFNQASVFWERKRYDEALKAYDKALLYLPKDPLLILLMGYCKVVKGDLEEGRTFLQQVAHIIPEDAVSKESVPEDFLQGNVGPDGIEAIFSRVDETRDSLLAKKQTLEAALKNYPRFREGLFSLAGTWLQLHRTNEALEVLNQYHQLDASNATVEYYLAVLYTERLDYNRAWKHLHQAEELTQQRQHHPEALKELRKTLALRSPE